MHPAPSVIVFTVLSGIGFGFLFFLGLGLPVVTGFVAFWFYFVAFGFAVTGLLASTFHLGHPERAWRAFTQWKTSWLSREAWLSVAALLFMGIYAAGAVFFDTLIAPLGLIGAILSLATVYSTAMIYGQLKTVPRWNHWMTPLHLMSLALAGGAILSVPGPLAVFFLLFSGAAQIAYWVAGDRRFQQRGHTLGTATGLGERGDVRQFEPPHTGTNYLLDEMVYQVGRKHARRLRSLASLLNFVFPIIVLVSAPPGLMTSLIAILAFLAGTFASRWLFFAEAEHVVGLYYGARA